MTAHEKLMEELRAISLAPKMTIKEKQAHQIAQGGSDKTESD